MLVLNAPLKSDQLPSLNTENTKEMTFDIPIIPLMHARALASERAMTSFAHRPSFLPFVIVVIDKENFER